MLFDVIGRESLHQVKTGIFTFGSLRNAKAVLFSYFMCFISQAIKITSVEIYFTLEKNDHSKDIVFYFFFPGG